MSPSHRFLALACFSLAAGLVINAVLGPLVTSIIDYRYTETFENQGLGLDAFALAFAAPLLVVAGVLVLRGNLAGPFLALAPALMAAYMFPQYVLGAHYDEIPGNNEDFFPLHVGLFVLSAGVVIAAWLAPSTEALPRTSHRYQVWTGVLLCAVAAFLLLRYIPSLLDIWQDRPSDEYLLDPIAFWLIAFMDLGIVMPAALACSLALLKGVESALKPMYAIVGWFAMVGPAVAAMGVAMLVRDDPNASLGGALAFAVYGGAFALLAGYLFRPLLRTAQHDPFRLPVGSPNP